MIFRKIWTLTCKMWTFKSDFLKSVDLKKYVDLYT